MTKEERILTEHGEIFEKTVEGVWTESEEIFDRIRKDF